MLFVSMIFATVVSIIIWPSKLPRGGLNWSRYILAVVAFPITLTNSNNIIKSGFHINDLATYFIQIIFIALVSLLLGCLAFFVATSFKKTGVNFYGKTDLSVRELVIVPTKKIDDYLAEKLLSVNCIDNLDLDQVGSNPDSKEGLEKLNKIGEVYLDNGEIEKAIDAFTKAAESGHVKAQLNLGMLYMGMVGNRNRNHVVLKNSVKWIRLAAQHGNSDAQLIYGGMHLDGWSAFIKPDADEARAWYQLSANQGNEEAKFLIKEIDEMQSQERLRLSTK
jgi:hypothetical protein